MKKPMPMDVSPLFYRPLPKVSLVIFVLFFLVLATAIAVGQSAHESRLLLKELYQEIQIGDEAQSEWGRLVLEQSTWTAHNRIELLAVGQLKMRPPEPGEVIMVNP